MRKAKGVPSKETTDAYTHALRMLARREFSEAAVRQRLAQRGHDAAAIEPAIDQLKRQGAVNDERVAEIIARSETSLKHRGKLRVTRAIEGAGIASNIARRVVDQIFDGIDSEELLERSLARRLRGGRPISDEREFRRLYRYLVAQGFESVHVLKALSAKRTRDQ